MLAAACITSACGDDDAVRDADVVDAHDLDAHDLDATSGTGVGAGPAPAPAWPRTLPPTEPLGERRGRRIARSIVHVHSPLSHDACDGEGWVDGELADPDCLAHFRAAPCDLHIDAAMVTDHAPRVNEGDFRGALWLRPEDEAIGDPPYATRMACDDAHRTLLTVGSENRLMPIGLRRHPGEGLRGEALVELYHQRARSRPTVCVRRSRPAASTRPTRFSAHRFVGESGESRFEMGDSAPLGATLPVRRPRLPDGFPNDPAPNVTVVLYRAADGGAEEIARTTDDELVFVTDRAGTYRVEVRMMPHHIGPFVVMRADRLVREVTWVYLNPIFVDLDEPAPVEPDPTSLRSSSSSPAWRALARHAARSIPSTRPR